MSRSLRAAAAAAALTIAAFPAAASASETLPGATTAAASGGPALPIALGLGALALGVGLLLAIVSRTAARPTGPVLPVAETDPAGVESPADAPTAESLHADVPDTPPTAPPRRAKPALAIIGVVGVLLVGAAFAVGSASKPQNVNGTLTRTFGGAASACTSTSLGLTPVDGASLQDDGGKLLDAFQALEGIGTVTLDAQASRIDVQFCDSTTSEDAIKQALAGTGLVSF